MGRSWHGLLAAVDFGATAAEHLRHTKEETVKTLIGMLACLLVLGGCLVTTSTGTPAPATTTVTAGGGAVVVATPSHGLVIGGRTSNFGTFAITPGFLPDPHAQRVVSGGNLSVSSMGFGGSCRGHVTAQPDYIMMLTNVSQFLRVYVQSGADTTLLINASDGSWHCNDDSYGGLNPTVDFSMAQPGQYDIWVGSYQAGVQAQGIINITEIAGYHP